MSNKSNIGNVQKKLCDSSNLTLTAVALQDHWARTLSLGSHFGPKKIGLGPAAQNRQKHEVKSVIDTGRLRAKKKATEIEEKEYVLGAQPPPLTLAQKFGLVNAPKPLLSEQEWTNVKAKSNQRDDSKEPCVICKEDFGLQKQVLLSCTHVFHKACLEAFERFTGRKTCPMCRHEQYQIRIIHEGARAHKHKSATRIQSCWRGYVVRCWYKQLREAFPPKDPTLRKKFYQKKLSAIVDRMINSFDINMAEFLREIDTSIQASRAVFNEWDVVHNEIPPDQWDAIQLKAVERGDVDCPICLTELHLTTGFNNSNNPDFYISSFSEEGQIDSGPTTSNSTAAGRRKIEDRKLLEKLSNQAAHYPLTLKNKDQNDQIVIGQNDKITRDFTKGDKMTRNSVTCDKVVSRKHDHGTSQSNKKKISNASVCGDLQCNPVGSNHSGPARSTVLLSCTHVFHTMCLKTLEEIAMMEIKNTCPVCRAHYQKKTIVF